VKLTVQIKLLPTPEQAEALRSTLELANSAANRLSQLAWDAKELRQFPMHKAFYRMLRDEHPGISSQVVVRLLSKVADAYKLDQKKQRVFRKHGSISYDARILDFQLAASTVSIWVIGGRIKRLPFVCGEAQRKLLELPKGESDLILRGGKWFLNVTVEVPEEKEREATGWLGVDLGVVVIAQTSDGETFSGAAINNVRCRHRTFRRRLQKIGTRSARRKLAKRRRSEARFATDLNHCISKKIVAVAKRTNRGIAVEKLTGIRSRIRASKKQRARLHSWAFAQLNSFLAYKSRLAGVSFKEVDPRNSSRECSCCGHVAKANRKTQSAFKCLECGHEENADTNASRVISRRAAINRPIESELFEIRHVAGLGSRSNPVPLDRGY
jgi:putative transposase